jgi:hypothetical protein
VVEFLGIQLGTFAQVLTMLFSGGIFGVLASFYLKNRALTIDAAKVLREHYAAELKRLTDHAIESDKRHEECESAKRQLRIELDKMHDELEGLHRQIARYSSDNLMILESSSKPKPSEIAPDAVDSAPRVRKIVGRGEK